MAKIQQASNFMRPGAVQRCEQDDPISDYVNLCCDDMADGREEVISMEDWQKEYRIRQRFESRILAAGGSTMFKDEKERGEY